MTILQKIYLMVNTIFNLMFNMLNIHCDTNFNQKMIDQNIGENDSSVVGEVREFSHNVYIL